MGYASVFKMLVTTIMPQFAGQDIIPLKVTTQLTAGVLEMLPVTPYCEKVTLFSAAETCRPGAQAAE
jgi:hypothetical protein